MSDLLTMTTLGGFSNSFLSSLRVLFDILDDHNSGYVKLSDIAERWRDDGSVDSLPPGVTTALRQVAPPDGKLTFDRFVAGLRLALLQGVTAPEQKRNSMVEPNPNGHKTSMSNIGPPSLTAKQRAFALSTAQIGGNASYSHNEHGGSGGPIRSGSNSELRYSQITNHPAGRSSGIHSESDLVTKWQQRPQSNYPIHSESDLLTQRPQSKSGDQEQKQRSSNKQSDYRKPGDGKSSTSSCSALDQAPGTAAYDAKVRGDPTAPVGNQRAVKRRDSRRHTLANGVDFNMIKRMKQLEKERDVLLQGLEVVDCARGWYQQKLRTVQQKQHSAPTQNDHSIEAHQERISLQMARIFEVNQQLKALIDSSEKGLPFHMSLALSGPGRPHQESMNHATELREKDTTITWLKTQNRMLTQEVSSASEKLTHLELEKSQLIRELFEARMHKHKSESNTPQAYDDTTFL